MSTLPEYMLPPATKIPRLSDENRRKKVVIVASRSDDPLVLIGPMNVLRTANFVLEHSGHLDMGYDIEIVASDPQGVFSEHGLTIAAGKPYSDLKGAFDTLLLAPMHFEDLLSDPKPDAFLAWVQKKFDVARRIGTFCSGTYILAEAGLLTHRRVTTHWDLEKDFNERYPNVQLDVHPIFIQDGHLYTSAGMTASLDMMVALVEEDFGQEVALRTAQALVLFLKRPGNQAQFSTQLSHNLSNVSEIAELQGYIHNNIADDLRVERLAEKVNMSPRTFSRTFAKQIGVAPGRYIEQCRLELARQCLEDSPLPVSQVAERCGYRTSDTMRSAFERQLGLSPRDYRRRFASANVQ